jgi:hypothetical protein
MLDRCVERLLHTMITRDEGRINSSHCLSAGVGFEPLSDQTRSPPRDPTVEGREVREQGPLLDRDVLDKSLMDPLKQIELELFAVRASLAAQLGAV